MSFQNRIRAFSIVAVSLAIAGCDSKGSSASSSASGAASSANVANDQSQYRKELLQSALRLLNTTEHYQDESQVAPLVVERLNQWRRAALPAADANNSTDKDATEAGADSSTTGDRDPLLDTLKQNLLDLRWFRRLNSEAYDPTYDGQFLLEAAMLRDVKNQIGFEKQDDLSIAQAIFDWTVRNIQLEPQPGADATPAEQWLALHLPLDTLYLGKGTPLQRAWVFMLLARQAGLDVVLLATPEPRDPTALRPWVTALVDGDHLYLFDYTYGLPILGPGGKGVATLAQAAEDESLLRQMDIPGDRIYPKKAADVEKVTALIEASPGYLERRMKTIESQLSGNDRMHLNTSPSELAAKLRENKHVGDVKLWAMPYETLKQRAEAPPQLQVMGQLERLPFAVAAELELLPKKDTDEKHKTESRAYALRLARLLHLRGKYGASAREAANSSADLSEAEQRGAKFYYLRAVPQEDLLKELASAQQRGLDIGGRRVSQQQVDAVRQSRDDAVYWLGLVFFEQRELDSAMRYFDKMTLRPDPDGPWANGARYMLGRCYEALGKNAEAIKLYEDDKSPQRYGNRLRAARLTEPTTEKATGGKSSNKTSPR